MKFPALGFGVGLRHTHFPVFREKTYKGIDWVEVVTENYLPWPDRKIRKPNATLMQIRRDLPIAIHGVSLSIGSTDALDMDYLARLREFISVVEPAIVSDHLCWTGVLGKNSHDLLPLPYTDEAIQWVADRISRVQDFLGREILIENVSSYVEFDCGDMMEWEFIREVSERADCGILLDVNNVYVSSVNHEFDPMRYLENVPYERVGQIHLAGHANKGNYLIDTHDSKVCKEVWSLYRWVSRQLSKSSVMIERDDHIPPWPKLEAEVQEARELWELKYEPATRSSQPATAL